MHVLMCAPLFRISGTHCAHHAEIVCVVRPINYSFYTGQTWRISTRAQVQPNIFLKAHLFASARLSLRYVMDKRHDNRYVMDIAS